jgi:hypothetical protein
MLATGTFAASAQTTATSAEVGATAQAQPAELNADAAPTAYVEPEVDRHCLHYTGTRIISRYNTTRSAAARAKADKDKACVGTFGRAYSREDIDRTGEVDLADALRKLDPAVY